MCDDWFYVKQHAALAGYRLMVLANRLGCDDEFSRRLHDRLAAGLDAAIQMARQILDLQSELIAGNDPDGMVAFQLQGEEEIFASRTIVLLDEVEIDHDTHEYRINGGDWHCALSVDCDGVDVSYPGIGNLSDAELGSLAGIITGIARETGIAISVARLIYD